MSAAARFYPEWEHSGPRGNNLSEGLPKQRSQTQPANEAPFAFPDELMIRFSWCFPQL